MAHTVRNFLNYTGLQDYNDKIKNLISTQIANAKTTLTTNYQAADSAILDSLKDQITTLKSTIPKNVYITVKVGTTEIQASGQSVLNLVAGNNITLTSDATNKKITITAKDTTYSVATASSNGLLSSTLFTKLNNGTFYTPDNSTITASSNKLSVGSIDASKITSGTISIDRLPAAALERCVIVADDTARLALTSSNVQLGDTVKVTGTKKMYMVVDATKLGTTSASDAFTEYVTSADWSTILNKPDTLVHTGNLAAVAFDGKFASLINKPTTLSGYEITDAYTKTQTDNAITAAIGNAIAASY